MGKKLGKQTIMLDHPAKIIGNFSIVGEKEGQGNFASYFDMILKDDKYGEKTYEKAEKKMMLEAIKGCLHKAHLTTSQIELYLAGDLLNQIISASFSARELDCSYLGIYGACSTMSEILGIGALLMDTGAYDHILCATGSHFTTAERQYRYPLELGNQRPPTSQWTITGAGASILSKEGNAPKITHVTFGKVMDYNIKDVNNMGAAMAPAAMDTLITLFQDTHTQPKDYDLIVTGDLGKLGSEILMDLMENKGYTLGKNYADCGQMMYTNNQKTYQGGSGAGCSAVVFNSYLIDKLKKKEYKKIIFAATGALLSTTSSQQGESIPGICHAIIVEGA